MCSQVQRARDTAHRIELGWLVQSRDQLSNWDIMFVAEARKYCASGQEKSRDAADGMRADYIVDDSSCRADIRLPSKRSRM